MLLALCLGLTLDAGVGDQTAARRDSAAVAERIDRYMHPYLEMRDFSGVVLVARRGRVLARRAYGLSDQALGVPATPETAYGIGSVSKTFTAAAILLLAERGQLSLKDPVAKYLPSFAHGDSITIVHLLGHESGLQDYFKFPEYAAHRADPVSLADFVALAQTKPLDFTPGSKSSYSGTGYKVLAYLIECVSGMPYASFLEKNIFAPLRLGHIGDLKDNDLARGVAPGYDPGFPPARVQPAAYESRTWLEGNGSLYSTADALYRWAEATRTDALVHWSRLEYPFGWGKRTRFGRDLVEQTGRVAIGYTTYLAMYPGDDVVIVVLSNIQAAIMDRVGRDVAAIVFGEKYELPSIRPGTTGAAPGRTDSTSLAAFAGRYEIAPGFVLTVKRDSRGLWLAGPDGAYLVLDAIDPAAGDRFFFRPLYVPVTFERDSSRRVTGLDWDGQYKAKRIQ